MTPQDFAARLHGRAIRHEIDEIEANEAKANGLVVMYGASDDLVELSGAIDDEVGAYDGTTLRIGADGLMPNFDDVDKDDEAALEAYFLRKHATHQTVEAEWSPDDEPTLSWRFKTAIPHATFDVMEDGDVFCRGIVFRLADIA